METDREGNLVGSDGKKKTGKEIIKTWIEEPEMMKRLTDLTVSSLAVYKNQRNLFENLANILTVALGERWGSDGVYLKYREWTRRDYPLQEIMEYLDIATNRIDGGTRRIIPRPSEKQTLITEFFIPIIPNEGSATDTVPGTSVDLENNQSP